MTPEEKQLLLKDLCARLPYGIKVKNVKNNFDINNFNHNAEEIKFLIEEYGIKPYLHPISSMTDEEKEELYQKTGFKIDDFILGLSAIDWFNEHHFDYRGLIEKGLAFEAPEGMYDN